MKLKKMVIRMLVLSAFMVFMTSGSMGSAADDELITFKEKHDTVYVGEEFQLEFNGKDSYILQNWDSSSMVDGYTFRDCRAEVDMNGYVTTYAPGYRKIYACYWGDDTGYDGDQASISLRIQEPYLKSTKIELKKGKKARLELVGAVPISYKSSNKKIVKVSKKGKITAKNNGFATVTVKDSLGRTYKCLVIVGFSSEEQVIATINEKTFPDSEFREYVSDHFDENYDDLLTINEIYGATSIDCSNLEINSLTGIEYFSELKYLQCRKCSLKELKLSSLKELEYLDCANNELESLDLSGNKKLKVVLCGDNKLDDLNLKEQKKLKVIGCTENNLTQLDLSKNTEIESIDCYDNRIKTLNISGCNKLKVLCCRMNELSELNLREKRNLQQLDICGNDDILSLDLDNNTELWKLDLGYKVEKVSLKNNNKIRVIFLGAGTSGIDLSYCPELLYLDCNGIAEIDVSNNKKLRYFNDSCQSHVGRYGGLKELDVSNNLELVYLDVRYTSIQTLDVSKNAKLKYLNCVCKIDEIDVRNNILLEYLDCSRTFISDLDISKNIKLNSLYCYNCPITNLDLSNNVLLEKLYVFSTGITELDLRNNVNLTDPLYIGVSDNVLIIR